MHQTYRDLIEMRAVQTVGAARAAASVSHSGLKGTLREIFVRDLLHPILPPDYIAGTGLVIDAYGNTSGQTDIVVCDRRVLPPILLDQTNGVFPVEAVIATIEVKSTLNAAELRNAYTAAQKVKAFAHAPPVGQDAFPDGHRIEHVTPYVFAFGSDLTSGAEGELRRYASIDAAVDPAIRGLCVVGSCCWFRTDTWTNVTTSGLHGEVVAFMAGLVNTCQRISATRFQPNLFQYLV